MARNVFRLIGTEDFPQAAAQSLTPADSTAALQALGIQPTAGHKLQSYLFLAIPFHNSLNSQVLDYTMPSQQREEGDGQVGAISPAMNEAKQVDVLAHLPDTAQLNDLVSSHNSEQQAILITAHIGSYNYQCKEN